MRTLALALICAALGPLAGRAAAQPCCGDCNGDGAVAINELITAVNNALSNCAAATATQLPASTPTPTVTRTPSNRCPLTLDEGGGACGFRGPFNNGCGNQLDSVLSSDGNVVVVAIDTQLADPPVVYFAANVVDATHATLTAWSNDNFQDHIRLVSGQLELANNREDLIIFPDSPPFEILSCQFVRYQGDYTGSSGRSAVRHTALQAWRDRPIPELAE